MSSSLQDTTRIAFCTKRLGVADGLSRSHQSAQHPNYACGLSFYSCTNMCLAFLEVTNDCTSR
jgi:hypothetical protein